MKVDDVIGHPYDPSKNQMPYGGATDIHGTIVQVVTKEEHDEMMARIKRVFGD